MCICLSPKGKRRQAKGNRYHLCVLDLRDIGKPAGPPGRRGNHDRVLDDPAPLRLLLRRKAKQCKTKGQSHRQTVARHSRWRETNDRRKAAADVASHHGGRGLGGLLDDGGEVAQVEGFHLSLVLLQVPLPRRLVRRHPLRLRDCRLHLSRDAALDRFNGVGGGSGVPYAGGERGGLEGGGQGSRGLGRV
jgi:hypothetical protein